VALEGYRRLPDRVAGLILVAGPYASPFHTMYGSDLGDRLFPLVRHGVPLVPPALLRLWGPMWRGPLPYPVAALLGSMGERADPEDMDGYFQHMARLDPLVLVKVAEGMPDAELHVLGEASHSLPIEEPDALEALVLGWLAERFPPRGRRGPAAQSGATG
jgi:pimeloyl-ACP methyl ester carboxylesterase